MKKIAVLFTALATLFVAQSAITQTPEPLQSVYSTAALRALDLTAAPFGVERLSVSGVSGDAPPVKFMPDVNHVCSADDGGHCVSAHGNGFWVMMPAHSCVIDLVQYGAVGDGGVTDNTTSIQAAINSVQHCHNGTLVVPPQIFATHTLTINGPIKIQGNNTAEGSNSQFLNLGANTDLFDIVAGVAAVEIDDLDISMGTANSNSSGWAINASSSTAHSELMFNDLTITGACGGIIADVNRMIISKSVIFAGGGSSCDAIYLGDLTTLATTVEVRLIHNWIIGTGVSGLTVGGAGIHIADGGDIMLDHNSVLYMTNGLAVTPGANQFADLHGTGNLFDTSDGVGILFQPSSTGVIRRTKLLDTWQSNGASGTRFGAAPNAVGLLINPNGGTIEDISFNSGQIIGNTAGDILVDGGTNISFLNFQNICGVFGVAGGQAPAIELAANASTISIQNDHITQSCDGVVYTKQNFGIQFDGSNNSILVTGNTISGQSSAPTSGVLASGVSSNNIGLDDQALTQTIAASIAPGMFHTIVLTGTAATIQTIGACWNNNKIDIINNGNATYSTVGGNIASLITAVPAANTITRGICNSSNKWVLN